MLKSKRDMVKESDSARKGNLQKNRAMGIENVSSREDILDLCSIRRQAVGRGHGVSNIHTRFTPTEKFRNHSDNFTRLLRLILNYTRCVKTAVYAVCRLHLTILSYSTTGP